MAFRHIPSRRSTECLAEHRHETRHALIPQIAGYLLDRSTACQPFYGQYNAELLAPTTETHAGFPTYHSQERPPAHSRALRPKTQ